MKVTTAHVESVVNYIVIDRMSEKQQMRWISLGAHHELQVWAEIFNGRLLDRYRALHERLRTRMEYETAAAPSRHPQFGGTP